MINSLEIEKMRLENTLLKLQTIEKLSTIMKLGLVEPDSIRIDINEFLFFLKEGSALQLGEQSIDELTGD
jgi:hypothetical protein